MVGWQTGPRWSRAVLGRLDEVTGQLAVPEAAIPKVLATPRWGGKRVPRPRQEAPVVVEIDLETDPPTGSRIEISPMAATDDTDVLETTGETGAYSLGRPEQVDRTPGVKLIDICPEHYAFPSEGKEGAAEPSPRAASLSPEASHEAGSVQVEPSQDHGVPSGDLPGPGISQDQFAALVGVRGVPFDAAKQLRGVPSGWHPPGCPGPDVVPLRRVPAAPELPAAATDAELALWLQKAYLGAVVMQFGRGHRSKFFRRRSLVTKSKHFPALVAAARHMREQGIRPAPWALWSLRHAAEGLRGPPSPTWVFSLTRLRERRAWYLDEADRYCQGRTTLDPPVFRELVKRYFAMKHALHCEPDEGLWPAIAARWFPGGLYDQMVHQSRVEGAAMAAQVEAMRQAGDWIWFR